MTADEKRLDAISKQHGKLVEILKRRECEGTQIDPGVMIMLLESIHTICVCNDEILDRVYTNSQ